MILRSIPSLFLILLICLNTRRGNCYWTKGGNGAAQPHASLELHRELVPPNGRPYAIPRNIIQQQNITPRENVYDLARADIVLVDSPSITYVPESNNVFGQVIVINRGNTQVENVGTNPRTKVVNKGYNGPVRLKLSNDRTPRHQLLIEDDAGTIIWQYHLRAPAVRLGYSFNQQASEAEEAKMIDALASMAAIDATKADYYTENHSGEIVRAPTSVNSNGQIVEITKGGVAVENVGSNTNTFVINKAKDGPVHLRLSPYRTPSHRLIVYNGGTLLPAPPLRYSFLQVFNGIVKGRTVGHTKD